MRSRYILYIVLVASAVAIQWPLWLGKGGIARMYALEAELESIRAANDRLRADNDIVAAEIESLESGSGAVEERARMRLGMVRKDEVLFRFIPKGKRKITKPISDGKLKNPVNPITLLPSEAIFTKKAPCRKNSPADKSRLFPDGARITIDLSIRRKSKMAQQFIQQMTIYLKGGQTVVVPFNAEKAEVLNPQIEAFMKTLGEKDKKEGNFLFQGARVVLVRLSEVAGVDIVSLVRKEKAEKAEKAAK